MGTSINSPFYKKLITVEPLQGISINCLVVFFTQVSQVNFPTFFRSFLLTTKRNEPKKSRRQGASVAKNWRFWFRRN